MPDRVPNRRRSRVRTARRDGEVRTRRRGAALEDVLLRAAWEEVSAVGYANLTMEGVAARAGTSKPVLYRRWPNRAALVRAAMRHQLGAMASEVPDTGDLREDVLTVLRQYLHRYQQVGPDIARGLLTELTDIPQDTFDVVPGVMMAVLTRATERGEVRPDKLTPRIAALPGDLLRHELILARSPASDAFLAEIVDDIFLPLVTTGGQPRSRTRR